MFRAIYPRSAALRKSGGNGVFTAREIAVNRAREVVVYNAREIVGNAAREIAVSGGREVAFFKARGIVDWRPQKTAPCPTVPQTRRVPYR